MYSYLSKNSLIALILGVCLVALCTICGASAQTPPDPPVIDPAYRVELQPTYISIFTVPGATVYYTLDNTDPTPASTQYTFPFQISTSKVIKAIAVDSGGTSSSITTAIVQIDPDASVVYLNGLQLWLRADNGAITNGSTLVSKWLDVAGTGRSFDQATTSKQPNFVANEIQGLPAVEFTGTQNLKSTSNLNAFTDVSLFVVTNPTDAAPSGNPRLLDLGNGTLDNYNIGLSQPAADNWRYFSYIGSTVTNCTFTNGWTQNAYQLIEAVANGTANTATVYKNGDQGNQVTNPATPTVDRTSNCIGSGSNGNKNWKGKIAEIILYNRVLSATERTQVEGYLYNRYHFKVNTPIVVPASGMHPDAAVTLIHDTGSTAFYTLNDSQPVPGNPGTIQYTKPFGITEATHVRAIAVQSFGTSNEASAFIMADSAAANVPTNGLQMWQRNDAGVTQAGGSPPAVTGWSNLWDGSHNATATPPNNPTYLANALGSLPAINFTQSPTSQVMSYAGKFDYSNGFSAFIVNRIPTQSATKNILQFTQSNSHVNVQLNTNNRFVLNISNAGVATSLSGAVTPDIPQLFEVVQGGNQATLYRNGQLLTQGSMPNCTATLLNGKLANSLVGQFFEVLLYNRNVTDFERQAIESYLLTRYSLPQTPVGTPAFSSPNNTTFASPSLVAITGPPGAKLIFTTDGSAPSLTNPTASVYSQPILIRYSTTLKAISVINETVSSIATANFNLDPIQWPPPGSDTTPPVINLQLPTTAQ